MSDYIPQEYLAQIFKFLPVKTLLRFRCVSKSWKEVIDSDYFKQEHLAVQKPRLIVKFEALEPDLLVLDPFTLPLFDSLGGPLVQNELCFLAGTLHGVICLYEGTDIVLWNPSIRKSSSFPLPNYLEFELFTREIITYSGFWIDPYKKDYKVIILPLGHGVGVDGLLYSSIQQDWKSLSLDKLENCEPVAERVAIVIESVAYWGAVLRDEMVVLSFDFEQDTFDIVETPSIKDDRWSSHTLLCKWQETTLSLVYLDSEWRCNIYWRQQDSWVYMFEFKISSNVIRVMGVIGEDMQENSKIIGAAGFAGIEEGGELVLCDTRAGYVLLKNGPYVGLDDFTSVAYDFVESFISFP